MIRIFIELPELALFVRSERAVRVCMLCGSGEPKEVLELEVGAGVSRVPLRLCATHLIAFRDILGRAQELMEQVKEPPPPNAFHVWVQKERAIERPPNFEFNPLLFLMRIFSDIDREEEPVADDTVKIIPSNQPTVVHLLWRRQTVGYSAPSAFFTVFGKLALTFGQVKAIANEWDVRNGELLDQAAGGGGTNAPYNWTEFFQTIRERDYGGVGEDKDAA